MGTFGGKRRQLQLLQSCIEDATFVLERLVAKAPNDFASSSSSSSSSSFVLTAAQHKHLLNLFEYSLTAVANLTAEVDKTKRIDHLGQTIHKSALLQVEPNVRIKQESSSTCAAGDDDEVEEEEDLPLSVKRARKSTNFYVEDYVEEEFEQESKPKKRRSKVLKLKLEPQEYDEECDDNYEEIEEEEEMEGDGEEAQRHRDNLKQLIRNICDMPVDKPIATDFDVLQGKPAFEYGMRPRGFVHELATVLEHCPVFAGKNHMFYSELFHGTPKLWVIRLSKMRRWVEEGYRSELAKKFRILTKSSIIKEVAQQGFQGFNPFTQEEMSDRLAKMSNLTTTNVDTKLEFDLDFDMDNTIGSDSNNKVVKKKGKRKGNPTGKRGYDVPTVADLENPMSNYLANNIPGLIQVSCYKSAFSAHDFYHHRSAMIPELTVGKVFAMVAMVVSENSAVQPHLAKVILQPKTANTDVSQQMQDMVHVLNQAWGVTGQEMFKISYVLPAGKYQNMYRRFICYKEQKQIDDLGEEGVRDKLDGITAEIESIFPAKSHVPIVELETQSLHAIQLVDTLDFNQVNNISLLMGDCQETLTIRGLLGEEGYCKFENEITFGKGDGRYEQKYRMCQMVRVFLELFRMFTGVNIREMITHVPYYKEQHDRLRELVSVQKCCQDILEKVEKQCPHCGKVFKVNKTMSDNSHVVDHMAHCKLERSSCDCGLTFRTAREKRRHMLLVHSGIKYYECSQCNFINKSQRVLDNHFEYFHGFPGREEMCDLCYKTFKCRNHLQIHRFNHENYMCQHCHSEILGRVPYRNHMKKVHHAGFVCDVCSKICFNKAELGKHKKVAHEDNAYLTC